jgi:ParB/RepB/Spo0J family partition protein
MQLEFHQLDRRWGHLRVRHPARQRRLLASLAESGQQTPIVVVAAEDEAERYVVIDGYKRIAALEQLSWDTVEAVVWPMSEAAAVLLDRSLRLSAHETALEVGWLLAEMEQRFGYGLDELARRIDRSVSWVSRRLALVEVLPEATAWMILLAPSTTSAHTPPAWMMTPDLRPVSSLVPRMGHFNQALLGHSYRAPKNLGVIRPIEVTGSAGHPDFGVGSQRKALPISGQAEARVLACPGEYPIPHPEESSHVTARFASGGFARYTRVHEAGTSKSAPRK